jgi:propionyl-CoA synthetase
VNTTHPLYPLHPRTTGKPKGVVRDTGGCVPLKFSMQHIYDIKEDAASKQHQMCRVGLLDIVFIVYGPLINRNTTIILKENR